MKIRKFCGSMVCLLLCLTLVLAGCMTSASEGANATSETNVVKSERADVFPPNMLGSFEVEGTEYPLNPGAHRWERKVGDSIEESMTDAASPLQIAETKDPVVLEKNSVVTFNLVDDPTGNIYLWYEDGRKSVYHKLHDSNPMTLPDRAGEYIFEVFAVWENGEVSYTFVIEVE
ncbi:MULTISPECIES: hypothetical protein [Bacillaceae]|uniref:Uncharacterized protein n=1 Tax=Evansella alkalicola TaxID=745819 RepID=A0ABS6JNB7_9BACI|nr:MULTISPECIES: hypothetical protein [Bacillaceae]MBU9719973.1 hypothetical protein [Bacillus alkalicola]